MTVASGDLLRGRNLTGLDVLLPHLPMAFDPGTVVRLARDRWPAHDPAPGTLRVGRVHNVRYQPSIGCWVSHEIILSDGKGRRTKTILRVEVRPEGVEARWFWDDPGLPWLAEAADPNRAASSVVGVSGNRIRGITPIRYRPGSRCVLGYYLETSEGPQSVLGKIRRLDDSGLFATLAGLHRGPGTGGAPPILQPLAYVPELHMLLLPWLAGAIELRALVFGDTADPETGLRWMHRAGAALARLHGVSHPARVLRIGDHAGSLARYSAVVSAGPPFQVAAFDEAVERIRMISEDESSPVLSHGAFRADQLLVHGGDLLMVDLDGLCNSNPAADVGNLLAYMRWKAIREPHRARFIADAREQFLEGYVSERPPPDEEWMACYEAVSLLKIAGRRFRSLDVHEWPMVPQLIEEAHDLLQRNRAVGLRRAGSASSTAPQPRGATNRYRRLHEALTLGAMNERLEPLLAPLREAPTPPLLTQARVAARKPGNRWTIRYSVDGVPDGVVGKLYRDPVQADRVHRITQSLWNSPERRSGNLGIPRPLGWLPDLGMLLYLRVRGLSLGPLLLHDGGPEYAARAASWLAALHRSRLPLDRTLDLKTEMINVRGWSRLIGSRYPDLGPRAAQVAGRLSELAPQLRIASVVPIHKDFHWQHVLVDDGRAAVIDFDEVRWGDSSFDLAHFCAYLELLAYRRSIETSQMAMLQEAFVACYAQSTSWERDLRFQAFYAYTCMKIAKQLCSTRGVLPRPRDEEQHRQTAYMLGAASGALGRGLWDGNESDG